MWSAVRERPTSKYDRLGPGFYVARTYVNRIMAGVGYIVLSSQWVCMTKKSSFVVVFFTIATDTIAPLASWKQLRLVHQIAG